MIQEAQAQVSPRASNTGVLSTCAGVIVDWLSFTLPFDKGEAFCGAMGWELLPLSKGFMGYAEGFSILGGIGRVGISPLRPEMGFHVSLPASALAQIEDLLGFLSFALSMGASFSRVDVALDDMEGKWLTWARIDACFQTGAFTSRWRTFEPRSPLKRTRAGMVQTGKGWNCGSRASNMYCRLYDKTLERQSKGEAAPLGWIRCELEAKGEAAEVVARLLLAQDGDKLRGLFRSYLDFKEPSRDGNKTRWVTASWWAAFLGFVPKVIGLMAGQAKRTLADVEKWLQRQVSPSLALLLKAGGGDLAPILGLCEIGRWKLKPHHLAMLPVGA